MVEVVVKVSKPYVLIAGGYTGLRPVGQKRDYSAIVYGVEMKNTVKSTLCLLIRQRVYRETGSNRVKFTFQEG